MDKKTEIKLEYKKVLLWVVGLTMVTGVMIYFDKQKVYKEEKPPIPVVSLGEQQTEVFLGSYTWNDGEVKKELADLKEVNFKRVEYRDQLHIDFPEGKEPLYLSKGAYDPTGKAKYPIPSMFNDENVSFLGNYPSVLTLSLKAFWKNGRRAEYIVPLNVEANPPEKEYLPVNKGFYSLLGVYSGESEIDTTIRQQISEASPNFLMETKGNVHLEMARNYYPELQIHSAPMYLLFNQEKEVFRTDSVEPLLRYIKDHTYVSKKTMEGMVTKVDREFGFVYVDNYPFYLMDPGIRVGQKIQLEIANLNNELPYQEIVEKVEVLEEPDQILLNKDWLSNTKDNLSLLVIGDTAFINPFKNPQREDLTLIDQITSKKSLSSIKSPSIFVFNTEELVFQTDDYDNLLKYLFETEQLLPLKKDLK
ncbi:hypothetical protein M3175_09540 [Robertmurraya korlensis]|uniref:hypothetical protein n=1 Tax=Robertmurraya korlensis TaxID=519977 RepID=UPI00203FFFEA|nr:hypothetical protein [Robertmurraya korlensis]MCM3600973.1 hypothetical protein [Robertmurraya korlensis]